MKPTVASDLACLVALAFAPGARAATFKVINTNDSGTGSLRAAIALANVTPNPPHTTVFDIPGNGPFTINAANGLPTLLNQVTIDASGEALGGKPGVRVDGSSTPGFAGLVLGVAGSSVSYLSVTGFGTGIQVGWGADGAKITHCYVGLAPDGVTPGPNGAGIIVDAANAVIGNNTLDGNVISGNSGNGIVLLGNAIGSFIRGNRIGTSADGLTAKPNGLAGIQGQSVAGVTVGGNSAVFDYTNVISGNLGAGIQLLSQAVNWTIASNRIGVDADGDGALGNGGGGIDITNALGIAVGSTSTFGRNVIAGNAQFGISVGFPSLGTSIFGNYIGTDASGGAALPAQPIGVRVAGGNTSIGGADAPHRNVISGNSGAGVELAATCVGCTVTGNYVGTNAAGTAAVPNGAFGIHVLGLAAGKVGGSSAGEGNLVAGNAGPGIALDSASANDTVLGNVVGLSASGAALGNTLGILLEGTGHVVGDGTAGGRNVVSGNAQVGVDVHGAGHSLRGNYIGTNVAGSAAAGNLGMAGVRLVGASGVTVGGLTAGFGNVISGNSGDGVRLDANTIGSTVAGNRIGTNAAGNGAVGNGDAGVAVEGNGNTIGGLGPASANVIAGNPTGVALGAGTQSNTVESNVIGLTASTTGALPGSGYGILIVDSHDNQIGAAGSGNVIGGFLQHGIEIRGAAATGNVVRGNWIGTNPALAAGLGNGLHGIHVDEAMGNVIGGASIGDANVIADNGGDGIFVERGDGNDLSRNSLFDNGRLAIDVGLAGVHPNQGGGLAAGGNRGVNYPLLTSVTANGTSAEVEGVLANEPDTQYRVEVFASPSCDATGFGEARTYLGTTLVTTDDAGDGNLSFAIGGGALAGPFFAATVTDPQGNTSELSPCAQLGGAAAAQLQLYADTTAAFEGAQAAADVVVTRSLGLTGAVQVDFSISDLTAHAGSDYGDSDQTVTFGPYEVVKVVHVPLILDPAPEPSPEKAELGLANPTGGASLGLDSGQLFVYDADPKSPGVTVDDASVVEGDAGQKALSFTVHLGPSDHDLTLAYQTTDGDAQAGDDYEPAQDLITFPLGTSEKTIVVQVDGDTDPEADETFYLHLTNVNGGGGFLDLRMSASGTVVDDDDEVPGDELFADDFESGGTGEWSAYQKGRSGGRPFCDAPDRGGLPPAR
jgi:parallel beta-helix repeat protein